MRRLFGGLVILALFFTGCESSRNSNDEVATIITTEDAASSENIAPTQSVTSTQNNTNTAQSKISLTEQFLEGVWVNEFGFVCEYIDGKFIDPNCVTYEQVRLTESGIEDVNSLSTSKKITGKSYLKCSICW